MQSSNSSIFSLSKRFHKKDCFNKNLDIIFILFKVTWDFVLTFPILSHSFIHKEHSVARSWSNLVTLFFVNQIQFPRHNLEVSSGSRFLTDLDSLDIDRARMFVPCNSLKWSWIDSFTRRFAIVSSDADETNSMQEDTRYSWIVASVIPMQRRRTFEFPLNLFLIDLLEKKEVFRMKR